jgi:heme-degrading monooxygenase HmoA
MIGRIWRTRVREDRAHEYEEFARNVSLPMFRQQQGFVGVLMLRRGEECVVLTLWRSAADVAALDRSEIYRETVRRITERGFLFGEQSVESLNLHLAAVSDLTLPGSDLPPAT